jgi:DNA-directed RNA polymerase specialized sigma24 family protein
VAIRRRRPRRSRRFAGRTGIPSTRTSGAAAYTLEDAQDLTQEFFAQLLAKGFVARADPLKGKFRSFLLVGLKHLLGHDREKARRLKRGGGRTIVSIDAQTAEVDEEIRYLLRVLG